MPLGPDPTYSGSTRVYVKQQPTGQTLNGNVVVTEEVIDAGGLANQYGLAALNGVILPQKVAISAAPGAATVTTVTVQLQDNGGQPVAGQPYDFDVILSDSTLGVGVTAVTPSGGIAVTAGTQLNAYVAGKAIYVQCDATGKVVFTITDTARTNFKVMVQTPNGVPAVFALTTAMYG